MFIIHIYLYIYIYTYRHVNTHKYDQICIFGQHHLPMDRTRWIEIDEFPWPEAAGDAAPEGSSIRRVVRGAESSDEARCGLLGVRLFGHLHRNDTIGVVIGTWDACSWCESTVAGPMTLHMILKIEAALCQRHTISADLTSLT